MKRLNYQKNIVIVLAEERHRIILELLKEHNVVKLQDICERTQCSESKRIVRIICIILAALFLLSLIIVPLIYVFG